MSKINDLLSKLHEEDSEEDLNGFETLEGSLLVGGSFDNRGSTESCVVFDQEKITPVIIKKIVNAFYLRYAYSAKGDFELVFYKTASTPSVQFKSSMFDEIVNRITAKTLVDFFQNLVDVSFLKTLSLIYTKPVKK